MSPSALNSSSGPDSASRSFRLPAEIVRAVAVIERSGRSTRPAANQPRTAEPSVVRIRTAQETVNTRAKSALRWARTSVFSWVAALGTTTRGTAWATIADGATEWALVLIWTISGLCPVTRTMTTITVVPRSRNSPE